MSDSVDQTKGRDVADKWGDDVAGRGFAQVPNYLLLLNQFLDKEHRLSPVELLIVIQLVGNWWRKGDLPFPSMGTLAVRCGVSERQIQRAVNRLVTGGFLTRTKRRGHKGIIASNAYDLEPLVKLLGLVAKAFPNEFPRKITKEQRHGITALLTTRPAVEQDEAAPAAAVETKRRLRVNFAGGEVDLGLGQAPPPKRAQLRRQGKSGGDGT